MSDNTIRDQLADLLHKHVNFWDHATDAAEEAILAAGWRPPAWVIEAVAELDALPRGSAVLTCNGRVWQKAVSATTEWWPALAKWAQAATSRQLLGMGIVTVLHVPTEDWSRFAPALGRQSHTWECANRTRIGVPELDACDCPEVDDHG